MDNEKISQSMMDIEYIPRYQKDLGDALTYAKGKQSMAEFAKKCNINPVTFSRIVQGTIKKPFSQEEIKTIAENSDLPTEDIFESLMHANGMVPKDNDTPRRRESERRYAENIQRRETMQNIIMRSLFEGGKTLAPVFNTPFEDTDPTLKKSRFYFSKCVDFALRVQGYEPAYRNFKVFNFTGEEFANDDEKYKNEIRMEVRDVFFRIQDVFLRDMWEPEAFDNTLYTLVFANKDLFEEFFKFLEGLRFNSSFSLVLLDLDKQRFVEERFLPRHDGAEQTSLF